jgi:hypothetical protein
MFFGRIKLGEMPFEDNRKRLDITDKDAMTKAFEEVCENYVPVVRDNELGEEGGISETSCQNLAMLLKQFGPPKRVDIRHGEVVLVQWEQGYYLATGFAVGYMGRGPYSLAQFGEQAGFGDELELYDMLTRLDRHHTGTLWSR